MFEQMIPCRERVCLGCGRVFQPGEEVITQLQGLERSDRCLQCGPLDGEGWSQWRSQVPVISVEARQPASGEERALALLRQRCESSDGYLLAVYLERAGRLQRYRGKGPALFEDIETGEVFQLASSGGNPEAAARLIAELSGEDCQCTEEHAQSDDAPCYGSSVPGEA